MPDNINSASPSQESPSDNSEVKSFLIGDTESLPEIIQTVLSPENCAELLEAVLSSSGCLHAGEVREAWSSYLELVVEPAGWRALLRPSSDTLALLGLHQTGDSRPAMLVNVMDVICNSLEAEVELVKVSEDGEEVGNLATVPIDELFAVKQQEIQTLDLTSTVTAIDLIRFFYENIWMPWDEESEVEDWPSQHLHNRVQLHFSLMTGCGDQVRKHTTPHLRSIYYILRVKFITAQQQVYHFLGGLILPFKESFIFFSNFSLPVMSLISHKINN